MKWCTTVVQYGKCIRHFSLSTVYIQMSSTKSIPCMPTRCCLNHVLFLRERRFLFTSLYIKRKTKQHNLRATMEEGWRKVGTYKQTKNRGYVNLITSKIIPVHPSVRYVIESSQILFLLRHSILKGNSTKQLLNLVNDKLITRFP